MGIDDQAVTNEYGEVKGTTGLRVIDASIMPTLIGGNTDAPTMMIAEKISDRINQKI
jgi:choline dehydrogenase-like flavoprotein